jgi:predicted helicase
MSTDHRLKLTQIKRFDQLIAYLRDEMGWPIARDSFDDVDDLFYEFSAEELGIDPKTSAKILEIKRLRPLSPKQPWGIFFVKFEPKKLPVIALRRILGQVALKRRASANSPDRTAWSADDLLFISNYGAGDARQISFAHFSKSESSLDLPTLRVLGWNNLDTGLHLDAVAKELTENLTWPEEGGDLNEWRKSWSDAFKLGHNEVINTAKDLSIRLADLASSIRDRIKVALIIENDSGPLTILMNAFKSTLVNDLDNDSFADMYAQTIAYGLLSARITDPSKKTVDDFTSHMRTSPFLRELMETFLKIGGRKGKAGGPGIDFDELGVGDVIQLLDNVNIEAVLRDFGDKNRQEDPVMHFFEGFLQAYDKKIRKDRGVFYTPQPVVSYIVRSVHELLQTEFGLTDGLADIATWGEMLKKHSEMKLPPLTAELGEKRTISPTEPFVQILDPATGTATFLIEVIEVIHQTLTVKWKQQRLNETQQLAAWNDYVPKHLLPRLHAFELMMAPYAIAHMKVGLKLAETGYRFATEERARIYLTNALEPYQKQLNLPELDALAHEAASVNEIKLHKRFTVVIGNPPYSEKSKNEGAWITGLMKRYKTTIRSEEAQIKTVSNDYIKFLCFIHHTADLAEKSIVGVITSNGYLDGRLFRDLRNAWLASFKRTDVLNLHGSGRRGDAALEDENVFDILQGVCISIARRSSELQPQDVRYTEMLGRRAQKYERLSKECVINGILITPREPLFLFTPSVAAQTSVPTWSLSAIFGTGNPSKDRNKTYAGGFKTRQDSFTVAFDELTLRERIAEMADDSIVESQLREKYPLCSTAHFEFDKARRAAQSGALTRSIRRIRYRPFDDRPMIWSREVLCEPQTEVTRHLLRPNLCLVTSRVIKDDAFRHVAVARGPVEVISLSTSTSTNAYMFPLYRFETGQLFGGGVVKESKIVNLSRQFIAEMVKATGLKWDESGLGGENPELMTPEDIFSYLYALLHSPGYREVFADELLRDFPPIPLPSDRKLFRALARLGGELTALHLLESPRLDQPITEFIGNRNPEVEKISWSRDTVWVDKAQTIGFRGVREEVWNFHIGGYQVCEKWLKYRKGRKLSTDDIVHYHKVVVALSETISLMSKIDKVIEQHRGWPDAFQSSGEAKLT